MAVFRRTWKGRSPFEPDKEHLHHRILEMGHSQTRAVLLLYGWATAVAGTFVALAFVPVVVALLGGAAVLAIVLALLRSPPGRRINDDRAEQVS